MYHTRCARPLPLRSNPVGFGPRHAGAGDLGQECSESAGTKTHLSDILVSLTAHFPGGFLGFHRGCETVFFWAGSLGVLRLGGALRISVICLGTTPVTGLLSPKLA